MSLNEEYEYLYKQSAEAFKNYKTKLFYPDTRAKVFYIGFLLTISIYMFHQFLQHLHYQHCTQNLFFVFFFRESLYCRCISYGMYFIESRFFDILKNGFSNRV